MNHTKPKGGYVFMTYDEFQAIAEVIAMAEGGVERQTKILQNTCVSTCETRTN